MIFEQKLAAVDPIQLATVSGATKIPRFAAPTPPVVRPFLLTSQFRGMRGCCQNCSTMQGMRLPPDYGTLRGLGDASDILNGDASDILNNVTSTDPTSLDLSSLGVPSQGSGNISLLQTAAIGAQFIPGIGQIASVAISTFNTFLNQLTGWLGIGAGRQEANIIVPVQNQMMTQLGTITNQILTGQVVPVATLQTLYRTVWQYGVGFQEFVLLNNFTDRRASGQALNTVMPYIDGTCGYAVPVGTTATPGQFNCLTWGSGTIGGPGTNGMLGAIGRAIQAAGGTIPVLPDLHQTANQGIPAQSVSSTILPSSLTQSTPLLVTAVIAYLVFSGKL